MVARDFVSLCIKADRTILGARCTLPPELAFVVCPADNNYRTVRCRKTHWEHLIHRTGLVVSRRRHDCHSSLREFLEHILEGLFEKVGRAWVSFKDSVQLGDMPVLLWLRLLHQTRVQER
jgi:hypothetical protein